MAVVLVLFTINLQLGSGFKWYKCLNFQNTGAQKEENASRGTMGKIWFIWFDLSWAGNSREILLWNRALELFHQRRGPRSGYLEPQAGEHQWARSIQVCYCCYQPRVKFVYILPLFISATEFWFERLATRFTDSYRRAACLPTATTAKKWSLRSVEKSTSTPH